MTMKEPILPPEKFFEKIPLDKNQNEEVNDLYQINVDVSEEHFRNILKNEYDFKDSDIKERYTSSLALGMRAAGGETAHVFRHIFYADQYPDLKGHYGYNQDQLTHHWTHHGIKEGRQGSPSFFPKYYLNNNLDISRRYGQSNYQAAIAHWQQIGLTPDQGRRGSKNFDPIWYCRTYPDLWRVYGQHKNWGGAANHYIFHGWMELRLGSPDDDNNARQPI